MSDSTDDTRTVTLRDGRTLAYREYGDPQGRPVLTCHGGLLCGLDVAPFDSAATALGLRLISPDRPGLGRSDPLPGRSLGDWADDVHELLDAIGAKRCAVYGWSMGGQYALGCASFLGERVSQTVVVAGCLPLDHADAFAALNAMDRRLTLLSQRHPKLAADTFRALGETARRAPAAWMHLTLRGAVPDEKSALEENAHPAIAAAAAVALEGGDGMVEEYRAWVRPWGFHLEDVPGAVEIWQGDGDDLVPPEWGAQLAHRIPGGRLNTVTDAGHFVAYSHTAEILSTLDG